MNDDQSSEDSRDFDVTSESKSESELEDSEAESNSSNQSFKNWVRSLALDTSASSHDEDPGDSDKIHLVHSMKMIHTIMNQNALIIRFTEKD